MAYTLAHLNLPTPEDMARERRGKPFWKASKLDRAKANQQADRDDEKKLAIWRKGVQQRDGLKDRMTGAKLVKSLKLLPNQAHAHHVESRGNYDVRYDVRNGIMLSFETHEQVEHNEIRIVGTKFFVVNGKKYIDASAPVKFVKGKA